MHAGVCGGHQGTPESIADRPQVFATLTTPGLGAVHTSHHRDCRRLDPHPRLSGCQEDISLGQFGTTVPEAKQFMLSPALVCRFDALGIALLVLGPRESVVGKRPWTRLGAAGICGHVFYELLCGVGMPTASVAGPMPAAAGWAVGTGLTFRAAGRGKSRRHDLAFGVVNGMFLSAVLAHFMFWPKQWTFGLPWLSECEGLRGKLMVPYNAILYLCGLAAVAGLLENGRAGLYGTAVPVTLVPALIRVQGVEFRRLEAQARRRPAWWNRRLQVR
jgi:hypothetical protein